MKISSIKKYIPYLSYNLDEGVPLFKAQNLECWNGPFELPNEIISFYTDFMIIFLTVWVIFFPKSNLVFKVFNDLPVKPDFLK